MSHPTRHCLLHRALHRARLSPFRKVLALSLGISVAGLSPRVNAGNDAWSTNPTSGNFADANWTTGSTTPGASGGNVTTGDILYFGTSSITTLDDNLAAGFNLGGFVFNSGASAFTIGDVNGYSHNLTGNITNSSTSTQTINDLLAFTAIRTVTMTTGGGNVILGGNLSGTGGGLTLAGTGTLTLSGNNSFTGGVTVNSTGILQLQANAANTTSGVTSVLPTQNFTLAQLGSGGGATIQLRADSSVANSGVVAFDSSATTFGVDASGSRLSGTFNFDVNNISSGTGQTLQLGASNSILYTGTGSTGTSTTFNVTGGNGYTLKLGTVSSGNNYSLTFNPTTANLIVAGISNTSTGAITKNGAGTMTVSGAITPTGALTVNAGALITSGAVATTGAVTVAGGSLSLAGTLGTNTTNANFRVGTVTNAPAVLNILTGTVANNRYNLFVGDSGAGTGGGAVYQSGGSLTLTQAANVDNLRVGSNATGYGYYSLSGGTLTSNEVDVGGSLGGSGVMDVSGGTMTNNGYLITARGTTSSGVFNQTGGTVTAARIENQWATTSGALSVLNVGGGSGTASLTTNNAATAAVGTVGVNELNLVNTNTTGTISVANLLTNGSLTTGKVDATGGTNPTVLLNFNGGTLKASATNAGTGFLTSTNIDAVTVYSSGGTIDNNSTNITVGRALAGASGSGVSSIAVSNGGSGYIGAPVVTITGGSGTGATGYATLSGGAITGIVITSPGTGYSSSDTLTVTLSGGAGTGATVGTISLAANTSGGMTFAGSGTTTLSGANTYAGTTSINAGQVNFTAAQSTGLGSISLANSTTLGLQRISAGTTVTSTGGLTFGTTGATSLALDMGGLANPTSALASFAGALTLNGTVSVSLSNVGGLTTTANNTTLALLRYGSQTGAGSFSLTTTSSGHTTFALNDTSTALYLSVTAITNKWTGAVNGTWDINTTKNWSASDQVYLDGDNVLFDDTGANPSINLAANVNPASVTFNNSSVAYTISSSGSFGIGGSGGLIKNGSGTVTLNTTNSYTGGTTINAGTIAINNANSLGATTGTATINAGTLEAAATITSARNFLLGSTTSTIQVDPTYTYSSSGTIGDGASAGTLNKTGTGTLTLTGTSTYSGGTSITAGTLNTSYNLGAANSSVVVGANGTLTFTGNGSNASITNTITGSGNISNSGIAVITGDASGFTGTWTANQQNSLNSAAVGGVVPATSANAAYVSNFAGTNAFILGTAGTYNLGSLAGTTGELRGGNTLTAGGTAVVASIGNLNTSTTFAGAIANNASGTSTTVLSLTKVGTGTLTLTGANGYSGATTISGGTLAAASTTGNALASTSGITIKGGGALLLSQPNQVLATAVASTTAPAASVTLGVASTSSGSITAAAGASQGTAATASGGTVTGTTSQGLGALTLNNTATLTFGGASTTLVFNTFTPNGNVLTINGYSNVNFNSSTMTSGSGTDDRLVFQGDQSGNYADFNFGSGAGVGVSEVALDNGFYEVFGTVPVPEPATWLGGFLLVGAAGFSQRRRLRFFRARAAA